MTAPTDRPDGKFEQLWLPLWPLASDNLRDGIYRTSRQKALGKRFIEANPDAISNLLVVDIDHDDALIRAMWDREQWRPNAVVENPTNGHAHAVWALDVMSRDVVLAPARNDTVPIQEVSVQTACPCH